MKADRHRSYRMKLVFAVLGFLRSLSNGSRSTSTRKTTRSPIYSKLSPPASPVLSQPLSAYVGTYNKQRYGAVEITEERHALWMPLYTGGFRVGVTCCWSREDDLRSGQAQAVSIVCSKVSCSLRH